ncbi:hypothetical protein M8998_13690 [Sphingobacterium sp. lm-10]|uniref:5'-methylthioadenosine/S-adenosylhomocysteine nucleosidase family protein n=1 Tax=Sphingobacterium sp. lm-10 TaxID=2944904 RepID=UPI002021BBE4|nr:hypothetical protein [Sphingobacterium sp. lm-10]MCL7988998.1 hypothetical protein [Sphingobacterium sp. lm-10]
MILNKDIKTIILVANKHELSFTATNESIFIHEIGVGKVNALLSLATLYEDIKVLDIAPILLNVGTVGSTRYPVGHVLYPAYYAQGDAYTDGFFLENTLFLKGQGVIESIPLDEFPYQEALLTSDRFINVNTAFYEDIRQFNPLAFDMESYALANFCFQKNLPFHSIKIVSDNCDGTVKDWESILGEISGRLGDILDQFMKSLKKEKAAMPNPVS